MYKANTKLLGFHFYFQSQSFLSITKATKQTWTGGQNLTFARQSNSQIPPPTPTDARQTALRGPVIRSTPYMRDILFHRKKETDQPQKARWCTGFVHADSSHPARQGREGPRSLQQFKETASCRPWGSWEHQSPCSPWLGGKWPHVPVACCAGSGSLTAHWRHLGACLASVSKWSKESETHQSLSSVPLQPSRSSVH